MNTAMILAAGRGERLKPLTELIPKALCALNGLPLIEHHVKNLSMAGFERIVINHAYLGSKIRRHLGDGSKFGVELVYSPEPPGGLETGGGIMNALNLLGNEAFITVNADIYTDLNFSTIAPTDFAHLILVPKPLYSQDGDFGLLNTRANNEQRDYIYSGIACYHPRVFESYKIGRYSVTPLLRQLAVKQLLTAELYSGIWFDIGNMERLQNAHEWLASN